jgi:lipopolysaccharide heptosyltransferase II
MKILINALSGIGDAVMFYPSLELLKKHLPDAEIDMLAMFSQVRDIFSTSPLINNIYHIDFLHQTKVKSLKEVLALRKQRYDYSINVYPSNRWEYNVLQRMIGAKKRIAVKYLNVSNRNLDFINSILIDEIKDRHNVLQNFDLARQIAPGINESELGQYKILSSVEDTKWAEQYIKDNNLSGKLFIGFHAGSQTFKGHINKRWKNYTELAIKLAESPQVKILLFGTENDVNEAIYKKTKDIALIPGAKTITQSIALMRHCGLFVSNDTALMHIAAALQVPTVAIFGYTNSKELYPWQNKHIIVRHDLPCSPCFYNSPQSVKCVFTGNEEFKCIRKITTEEVYEACRKLIEEIPGNVKP